MDILVSIAEHNFFLITADIVSFAAISSIDKYRFEQAKLSGHVDLDCVSLVLQQIVSRR